MNRIKFFLSLFIGIAFWTGIAATLQAQQHVFTNKEGSRIVAEIVSVDPDWKSMTIRMDGKTFALAPNVLILDDQQRVKDWLKKQGRTAPNQSGSALENSQAGTGTPAPAPVDLSKVSIDVNLTKKVQETKRGRYSDYMKLESKFQIFEITVRSRGRETIPSPTVSWAVVWKEGVSITGNTYNSYESTRNEFALQGKQEFPQLIYNREERFNTSQFEINEVHYDGNRDYYKDELLGVVVKISLADGTTVAQFRDTLAENKDITWEYASKLRSGPRDRIESSRDDDDDNDSRSYVQMKKGESKEGPIRWQGKRVAITVSVAPDTSAPDGVIVAMGGERNGMSLYIKDRQLYACVRSQGEAKWIAKPLPLGKFLARADLDKSGLSLSIDDGSPASRDDVSLFTSSSLEGIDVGHDSDTSAGDYSDAFSFAGEISDLRILIRD